MEKYVDIKSPFTGGKVKEISTVEQHEFRNEQYSVHVRYYVCEVTGERFTTTEQDELLFNELYSQYRVNHGIPFPEEIKSIRLHYGLNYQQITKILGFGINQYAQYEKGQIPSESNGKLLSAIMNRQFMIHLLKDSRAEFDESEYSKVLQSILASVPSHPVRTCARALRHCLRQHRRHQQGDCCGARYGKHPIELRFMRHNLL